MTVEVAPFIDGLNPLLPAGTDQVLEGDDHIRLLKATIGATFPALTGAITANQGDLNLLAGVAAGGLLTLSGNLTMFGAFTSLGIDDNATALRLRIENTFSVFGPSDTSQYNLLRPISTGSLRLTGGDLFLDGGAIELYGQSHATLANDVILRSGANIFMQWDESGGDLIFNTGVGVKTQALSLDELQAATFAGAVTVLGAFTSLGIDDNATVEVLQLSDTVIQIGDGTAAENYAILMKNNDGQMNVSGGSGSGNGSNIQLFGGTTVGNSSDLNIYANNNVWLQWDESVGSLTFSTGIGVKSQALNIDPFGVIVQGSGSVAALSYTLNASTTGNPQLNFSQNGTQKAFLRYADSGDLFEIDADGVINLQPGNTLRASIHPEGIQIDDGGLRLPERSDHSFTPAATFGELWLKSGTIQSLMFTDDASVDVDLSGMLAIKATDTSRTNTTTLAADPDLTLSLAANTTYLIQIHVIIENANSTPDFKWDVVEADGTWRGWLRAGTTTNRIYEGASTGSQAIVASIPEYIIFEITHRTGGTGGTFALQWAQNVLDAVNATVVKANSWMKATRLR